MKRNRLLACGAPLAAAVLLLHLAGSSRLAAQGRAATPQAPPPTPKARAGIDLVGTWVPVISEDWRYRMMTPQKGDYTSMPLNAEARRVAGTWDPAKDEAAGAQCKGYGAAAVMRLAGRVRIAWEGDDTLRVDTEAGVQTRLLRFAPPSSAAATPGWQGSSVATWEHAGRGGRAAPGTQRRGHLKVVTTNLRPGYLRRNGVPYSANAVLTEYFNRLDEPNGDVWLIVTTMVDDPQYLTARFATSTHFKKVPAGDTNWTPEPCSAR